MKKTKLTLEKFRVSRLTNLSIIKGGRGNLSIDDGTITKDGDGPRCEKLSEEIRDN